MSEERLDLPKPFSLTFEINLGANDAGGDGMAFVLHNDPNGKDALGATGGGLGAKGIVNGLAIEIDTYKNADDPSDIANDHTNLVDTDNGSLLSPVTNLGNIEDGAWHTVQLTWDGTSLFYTFDGIHVTTLTANISAAYLGGSQFAWFGFTGATETVTEQSKVKILDLHGTLEDGAVLNADRSQLPVQPTFVDNGDATYDATLNKYIVTPTPPLSVAAS